MVYGWSISNPKKHFLIVKKTSFMVKYNSVKIPTAFVERIKQLIEKVPELGYRTHSEFIIESSREKLEKLEEKYKTK
jgi:hypothetical protein